MTTGARRLPRSHTSGYHRRDASAAASLRAQRDFLLRSIADLDAERATGELPQARYSELHNDYTVQAATVLRALDRLESDAADTDTDTDTDAAEAGTGVAAAGVRFTEARLPWKLRPLVLGMAAAVVIVAAGAGLLVRNSQDRVPGSTITGNAQSRPDELQELEIAARTRPDDADAQFEYGQALLEARRTVDALKSFDAAARLDPSDPAAKAYGGMVVYLAGLIDEAMQRLDAAVAADPSYPDGRFFRGLVRLRGRNDATGALEDLTEFLRLVPPGPERDQVQVLVDSLQQPREPALPEAPSPEAATEE